LWYVNRAGAHPDEAVPQLLDQRQHDLRVMIVGTDIVNSRLDEQSYADHPDRKRGGYDKTYFHFASQMIH
jgi:hypothetical protein